MGVVSLRSSLGILQSINLLYKIVILIISSPLQLICSVEDLGETKQLVVLASS